MQIKKLVTMYSRTGREFQKYNSEGCRLVVGCIPYRFKKTHKTSSVHGASINELEFLLISSQKSSKLMFPKGGWEDDESMEDAATRETMEEAGVLGIVGEELGVWSFKSKSQDTYHEGHMLAFEVTEELDCWPEKDVRTRVWVSADEARIKCAHEWMIEALDKFIDRFSLDLLRSDESTRERQSVSKEDKMTCNGKQSQRKEIKEEDCLRLLKVVQLFPISPRSTEKSRMSRVSLGGEEDVDRVALSEEEEDVTCTLACLRRMEEKYRILFAAPFPVSPCSTEKSRMSRVSPGGDDDVDRFSLLVN